MSDVRPDEVIAMGPAHPDSDAIAMGPVRPDIEIVDDLRIIADPEMEGREGHMDVAGAGPVGPSSAVRDAVPSVDARDQQLPADPDAPMPPVPRARDDRDAEVPLADAWEQSQPADVYDDY